MNVKLKMYYKSMKKILYANPRTGKWRKILLIMKLKLFILLCCLHTANASVFSQEQRMDVAFENESVLDVINYLQSQTGYQFFYLEDSELSNAEIIEALSAEVASRTSGSRYTGLGKIANRMGF